MEAPIDFWDGCPFLEHDCHVELQKKLKRDFFCFVISAFATEWNVDKPVERIKFLKKYQNVDLLYHRC